MRAATRLAARLARLPIDPGREWTLNLIFVDDREMCRANSDYVGHEGTTDVITFCYLAEPESLFPGDIGIELILCADAAEREGAKRRNSSYSRELLLYLVHGLLHSAGEDDLDPVSRRRMRRREREVMKVLLQHYDPAELFPPRETPPQTKEVI
ncbi:rRNA maturation RNase YbeY [Victivallis sp. Marseille-Q1083]|uniref:rRNA maturation RNase YbeY n=1 Tax=Victivallis sp. Marseille-Q1083 TaxID=2717288 RepID=UPI00158F4E77|nr:rRNA maturation RNase YbeY [Victivallis sp. Marseille-Q1083]